MASLTIEQEAALMWHQQQIPPNALAMIDELAEGIRAIPIESWDGGVYNVGWMLNVFLKHVEPDVDEDARHNTCWAFSELLRDKLFGARN
jgi:hypothetical protein